MLRAVQWFLVGIMMCVGVLAWAESDNGNVSQSFKENAVKLDSLLFPSHSSHDKEEAYAKKVPAIYAKYFNDEDLSVLINYLQSSTFKKLHENVQNLDEDLHMAMGNPPGEKHSEKGALSKKDKDYESRSCDSDLKYTQEDIEKGLSRYKRVCGTEKFPDALDWAQDGKADYDNPFFSRVVPASYAPMSSKWSKKGNTYTYDCGGKKRSFVYDAGTGTFK
jgi:hypothetical protein